jgi:serine/threonine-protein kinase
VAVKVPSNDRFPFDEDARRRFHREGRNLLRISHANVLTGLAQVEGPDGQPGLALALADRSLDDELRRNGKPDEDKCADWLDQILAGTANIHEHGLIHRDLSAKNLFFMPDGRLVLGDFGTVRHSDDTLLTAPGAAMGSLVYIAPEQFHDLAAATPQSDLYSAGCVAFFIATGRRPIGNEPPLAAGQEVPLWLATFIDRLRSHDPSGRPLTGAAALKEFTEAKPRLSTASNRGGIQYPFSALSSKDVERILMADGWELAGRSASHATFLKLGQHLSLVDQPSGGLKSALVRGIVRQAGIDSVRFAELRQAVLHR